MMKYFTGLAFIIFLFSNACQSQNEEKIDTLKNEILEIHDQVMPKMGELRKTKNLILSDADSLMLIDSVSANSNLEMAKEIEKSNESMMNWMRKYEPEFTGTEKRSIPLFSESKERNRKG